MNNLNETVGLRVLSVSPAQKASNVNVNSSIEITFTADINQGTIIKNLVVLEDYNKIYKDVSSLKDYSQYRVVKGSVSYADRVLTFTPEAVFNTASAYVILINDQIADVTGNKMAKKHVSVFYTESTASYGQTEILSPKYGAIVNSVPEFTWKNQGAESYIFQVSKQNTFELLLLDEFIPGFDKEINETFSYTPPIDVVEGLYHARVRAEGGEWSNVWQFFIKPVTDAVVAEQDVPVMMSYEDFLDGLEDPLEILEVFPPDGSIGNSLKTNIVYIKIKGEIDKSDINLDKCFVVGELYDEEDDEDMAAGELEGSWSIVYDAEEDATYIIFTPTGG